MFSVKVDKEKETETVEEKKTVWPPEFLKALDDMGPWVENVEPYKEEKCNEQTFGKNELKIKTKKISNQCSGNSVAEKCPKRIS